MGRSFVYRVVAPAAFVVAGWFAGRAANGQMPPPSPPVPPGDLQASLLKALSDRVAALEAWRAQAGTFTADASGNWSFAPPKGNVIIAAPANLILKASTDARIAGTSVTVAGSAQTSMESAAVTIKGAGQTSITGAIVSLNGGKRPLPDVVGTPFGICPQYGGPLQGGQMMNGSTAPTVLVP